MIYIYYCRTNRLHSETARVPSSQLWPIGGPLNTGNFFTFRFFSALHGMPARTSDKKGVRLSVRLSNACIVTKRKKDLSRFLYHTKDHLAYFSEKKIAWWERPLLPEILDQAAPVGAKSQILNRYWLVAP